TVRELFIWMTTKAMQSPAHAVLFKNVRVQPRGPTVIVLQQAIARGELSPNIDIEMALHVIQGPFISKRIVDNSDISNAEVDSMVAMAIRALQLKI
ncbi:MAG: TetR-like C-terminal domain-containing protein, partial [Acidimicrobiales bacterium]